MTPFRNIHVHCVCSGIIANMESRTVKYTNNATNTYVEKVEKVLKRPYLPNRSVLNVFFLAGNWKITYILE